MSGASIPDPHRSRLSSSRTDFDEICRRHRAAVESGEPSYVDPASGLSVLTVATLLTRGTCCANLCRHCPYIED